MLTFPANVRLFLANQAVDGRKSFNGLAAIVESEFAQAPTSGDLFIFLNRRGTQVRLLFWDRDGFWLMAKRLEQGTFRRVRQAGGDIMQVEIDAADLSMLLEGVDARDVRRRKRYKIPRSPDSR
jgi:transposase